MTTNILEAYKFAKLATVAYVDLSGAVNFSSETLIGGSSSQNRFPEPLGQQFFVADGWTVLGDPRLPAGASGSHNSASGLAATLFGRPGANGNPEEKVLAVRGTEGSEFNAALYLDLVADLGEIGGFGIAISQLVDLVNLVFRHRAGRDEKGVLQLSLRRSANPPSGAPTAKGTGVTYREGYRSRFLFEQLT